MCVCPSPILLWSSGSSQIRSHLIAASAHPPSLHISPLSPLLSPSLFLVSELFYPWATPPPLGHTPNFRPHPQSNWPHPHHWGHAPTLFSLVSASSPQFWPRRLIASFNHQPVAPVLGPEPLQAQPKIAVAHTHTHTHGSSLSSSYLFCRREIILFRPSEKRGRSNKNLSTSRPPSPFRYLFRLLKIGCCLVLVIYAGQTSGATSACAPTKHSHVSMPR